MEAVLLILLKVVIIGAVFYLIYWFIQQAGLPAPFAKVAKLILAIAAVIILIYLLLPLI